MSVRQTPCIMQMVNSFLPGITRSLPRIHCIGPNKPSQNFGSLVLRANLLTHTYYLINTFFPIFPLESHGDRFSQHDYSPAFLSHLRNEVVGSPVDSKLGFRNPAIGSARRKFEYFPISSGKLNQTGSFRKNG